MNGYLNYFIEANIGLLLFLTAYMLLLRNETDFQVKRGFLLIGIFTSITFPLLHIQYASMNVATLSRIIPPNLLPQITITGEQANPSHKWSFRIIFFIRICRTPTSGC